MNTEEPSENQAKAAEVQAAPAAETQERRRHGGRRGRFRRGRGRGERESRAEGEPRAEREGQPAAAAEPPKRSPSIRRAIEQVLHVRAELRKVLDEIQEIVRTLEQAEREKTATEDEIEMLRESLRGLHRESGYPRNRGGSGSRPAPAPAASAAEPAPADEDVEDTQED